MSIRQGLKAAALAIPVSFGSVAFAEDQAPPVSENQNTLEELSEQVAEQVGDAIYYVLGYHLDGVQLREDVQAVDTAFCRAYVDNGYEGGLVACLQEITDIAEKLGNRAINTLDRGEYFGVIDAQNDDILMVRRMITNTCYAYDDLFTQLHDPENDRDAVLDNLYVKLSNCLDFSLLVLKKSEQNTLQEKSARLLGITAPMIDENYTPLDRMNIWMEDYPFDATLEDYIQRPRWFIDEPEILGWRVPTPFSTLNAELPSCDLSQAMPENDALAVQCLKEIAPVAENYGSYARDRLEYDYIDQQDSTPEQEWQDMSEAYARIKGYCYTPAQVIEDLSGEDNIDITVLRNQLAYDIRACFLEANAVTEASRAKKISEIAKEYDEIADALVYESLDLFGME